jgi:DNA-directed RNA polymerase specialized sigma24 family protein
MDKQKSEAARASTSCGTAKRIQVRTQVTIVSIRASDACALAETLIRLEQYRARLSRLPARQRMALSLIMVDGLSYQEAAERLNMSVAKLMKRLDAARALMAKMIEEDCAITQDVGAAPSSKLRIRVPFQPPVPLH